jgi:hypothetical protein
LGGKTIWHDAEVASYNRRALLALLAATLLRCASSHSPAATVQRYLHARTLGEASSVLAPDYTLWFDERKGAGIDRASAIHMLQWDYALHARHRLDHLQVAGNQVIATVHEDNDFSLLIGFPGWDATSIFVTDPAGRIACQLYIPKPGQPDWRPYLDAPLAWIREHYPELLPRIFPNGQLARSADAAQEWVTVLRAWRAATRDGAAQTPSSRAPAP